MRYFLDTEFNGFGGELISLALVSECNRRSLYVVAECNSPVPWVAENVIPFINCGTSPILIERQDFGRAIAIFLDGEADPQIIADWPDDIRYFCQAIITGPGEMVSIPSVSFHMVRIDSYPTSLPGAIQHNALWDARALREAFAAAIKEG